MRHVAWAFLWPLWGILVLAVIGALYIRRRATGRARTAISSSEQGFDP
ncbi:MAG: hypothetical protein H5T69_04935 [Chloroflexi bacterium]|nr:hypothetical protein [Chloroflexota bacterium]